MLPVTLAAGLGAGHAYLVLDLDQLQGAWVVLFAPPALLMCWCGLLALAVRRADGGLGCIFAGWIAFVVSLRLGSFAGDPVPFFQPRWEVMLLTGSIYAVGLVMLAGAGVVASLLAWLAVRCVVSPADAGALLCWRCGYLRAGLPVGSVCPECGSPAAASVSELAAVLGQRGIVRGAWVVCAAAALAPVAVVGGRYVLETMPRRAAAERFGEVQQGWGGLQGVIGGTVVGCAVRPLGDGSGRVLVLEVLEPGEDGDVAARVYLGMAVAGLPSPPGPYRPMTTLIYCELSEGQLVSMDEGLLGGLEGAFIAEAEGYSIEPLGCEVMAYELFGETEVTWISEGFARVVRIELR